ncbi:hypothetical protein [Arthrobacter roseus]|uniref:hypothetical protein n=1 Tax=Arthrobacter roseus TaxID=136274 RepID=UPI00196373D8|nr:hypothetical protein [Arthrobacter roseus]MBM7848707.1 putative membrane protein [Arthrobacter roseus]
MVLNATLVFASLSRTPCCHSAVDVDTAVILILAGIVVILILVGIAITIVLAGIDLIFVKLIRGRPCPAVSPASLGPPLEREDQ